MDVIRSTGIAGLALYLAMSLLFSVGEGGSSKYDPAGPRTNSKPGDGFVDFTLKRVNPVDRDYGQRLGEGRSRLLDETVENAYFWSNLVTLSLLACLFIIVVHQHRIQTKREWTMCEMLVQYQQALLRANHLVDDAAKRNRGLAESLSQLKQSSMRPSPIPADKVDKAPGRPTRSHTATIPERIGTALKRDDLKSTVDPPTAGTPTGPTGQIALFKPEVELVTRVNTLEQQLGRSQEVEKQLRRQLNDTGRRLQAEQEKNRRPMSA